MPTTDEDGPRQVGAIIAETRQRLGAARDAVSPSEDLDADEMQAMRERGVAEHREMAWRHECPQRFHRAMLDTLGGDVRAEVDAWRAMNPRPNLVLTGPVGCGKTHTALAAVRDDFVVRGLAVTFLPVVEVLDLLRPGGPSGVMDDLLDVPRLVLDDLGAERPTDWTAERLGALINRRWMEERTVIATTNLEVGAGKSLEQAIGERTYSRLVGSDAVVVRLGGKDRRRAG